MNIQQSTGPLLPIGFEFVRLLSERSNCTVTLARTTDGTVVAVKLLRLASGIAPDEALARHRCLQKLTRRQGLVPILGCGLTTDGGWLWESLPLADDLDGAAGSEKPDYTPATMRLRVIERGSFSAQETSRAGALLCEALACLHEAGLIHRDIKPANLFIVGGEVKLGDYGLVSAPGQPFDFNGTEGFQPAEGGADQGADLFALGKALYEIWTGCDRLEFPSLPKRILESADWNPFGQRLNAVLLRACHQQANARFNSAHEFRRELLRAADGTESGVSRRRWITTLAVGSAVGAAGLLLLSRRSVHSKSTRVMAEWKLLRSWDHLPSMWTRKCLAADSKEKVIYSLECQKGVVACHTIQLETLELKLRTVNAPFAESSDAWLLHPVERTLWCAAGGRGALWRWDPRSGKFSLVGGSGMSDKDLGNMAYWNPVTQRFGVMGGYGWFRVRNWRWEFDQARGEWAQLEADQPGREPWGRFAAWLFQHETDSRMFLFGGDGNSTGRQGEREPGLKHFDSHFHELGDLWSFDFHKNRWTNLVPLPGLECRRPPYAAYYPPLEAVVVLDGCLSSDPYPTPPRVHVFRPGTDKQFVEAKAFGAPPDSRKGGFVCYDPAARRLLSFFESGIYGIGLGSS